MSELRRPRPKFYVSEVPRKRRRIGRQWQMTIAAQVLRPLVAGAMTIPWREFVSALKREHGTMRLVLGRLSGVVRRFTKRMRRRPPFVMQFDRRAKAQIHRVFRDLRNGVLT